tara:strand:- start:473 stop:697 length:225 start_codon:yes stop_codon:yes gene_type:complete
MGFLDVHAIEVNDGQLLRENDSVRVETADDKVWYGTVNGLCVFANSVEVTVTDQDGADIQIDIDGIIENETQGW